MLKVIAEHVVKKDTSPLNDGKDQKQRQTARQLEKNHVAGAYAVTTKNSLHFA